VIGSDDEKFFLECYETLAVLTTTKVTTKATTKVTTKATTKATTRPTTKVTSKSSTNKPVSGVDGI